MIRRYEQDKQPSLPPHQDNESPVVCLTKLYRLLTPVFLGFSCGSAGKESACNVGDLHSKPGLGRSPGEGKGYPLQYSGLENSNGRCSSRGHKESDTVQQLFLIALTMC